MRKPLQGVTNIVRFNWPFYALAVTALAGAGLVSIFSEGSLRSWASILTICVAVPVVVSLLISAYVYDLSGLYDLHWLDDIPLKTDGSFANINAGFDETTSLLRLRYPSAQVAAYDFYDPTRHTEPSIRRARLAYPAAPDVVTITTAHIPAQDDSLDAIFLVFAAHEIRDAGERERFFGECLRVLRPGGYVIVLEHLRDTANFAAYNIGFFHFLPLRSWLSAFQVTGFTLTRQQRINPFVTVFKLMKNGNTL
ncbi:MAG: class I SAM-dependent methyltransferase [Bacteroidetes bacterium]|nr:class I SAM-dependent methyltransferase [Bacteroidota bacterium]